MPEEQTTRRKATVPPSLTKRDRAQVNALGAAVEREHVHATTYDGRPKPQARAVTATVRQRRSAGELVMPLSVFAALDYGQVCARLGLSPSRPMKAAA